MSDTPRTDAVAKDGWDECVECVESDFARQLERELERAMAELRKVRDAIKKAEDEHWWISSPHKGGFDLESIEEITG